MKNQTDNPVNTLSIVIKFGLPLGLLLIVLTLLFYLIGIDKENFSGFISLAVMFLGAWWATREIKNLNEGKLSFGAGFKVSLITQLTSGIISLIYFFCHITLIDKNFINDLTQKKVEELQRKGLDEASIEQAMQFMSYMSSPITTTLLGSVNIIFGALISSLIISAIMKKE